MDTLARIAPRRLEGLVPRLMADEPVVVLAGARTVGKSTLLARLAQSTGATVLDLDDLTTRALVRDDLSFYVNGPSPVLVDEFQHLPELLDAIKATLNVDPRPGRFLLTGSTRYSALPRAAQSLTGRVHVETVWPLSQVELAGGRGTFVARLLDETSSLPHRHPAHADHEEYARRVLAGGLPAALRRTAGRPRSRWYEDYVALVVERDVLDVRDLRQSAV
ncbi:MAG: ATP-binding protein, partial [Mycobacteriales bacterium]